MDIHRCRFSEWMPSAACAAIFHPELPLIVVGRENGDIELWNTQEKWFCESVFCWMEVSFPREFLVTKTCRSARCFGLSAFPLLRHLYSGIVSSEQVFRVKSSRWTWRKCRLLVEAIVTEVLCGWLTEILWTTLSLVRVKTDPFVFSIFLERMLCICVRFKCNGVVRTLIL